MKIESKIVEFDSLIKITLRNLPKICHSSFIKNKFYSDFFFLPYLNKLITFLQQHSYSYQQNKEEKKLEYLD